MLKTRKFIGSTSILLIALLLTLSGVWGYGPVERVLAQSSTPVTIYIPAICNSCPPPTPLPTTSTTPTPTPTTPVPTASTPIPTVPEPTLTPTPTATLGILRPALDATYGFTVTNGIQYGAANIISGTHAISLPLYLDLYEPVNAPAGKRPVVMWMFGSGFTDIKATRKGGFVPIAQELAKRGYVVISIDYRTAFLNPEVSAQAKPYYDQVIAPFNDSWVPFIFTNPPLTEDQYERAIAAAYDDGLTALKWIVSQAGTRTLDTERVAVMGSSSGSTTDLSLAYLSNNIGVTTPKIAAVLDLWGSMDYSRAEGLTEIEANEAPVFIIHSIGDTALQGGVDYVNAKDIDARASAVGLPHQLITLTPDPNGITPALKAGTGHGLSQVPILNVVSDNGQTLFQRLVVFLNNAIDERKLKPSLDATYNFTVTNAIQYGAANIITTTITGTHNISLPLYLDLYQPVNAPVGKRPVVMWMFGSGFTDIKATRKGGFVPIAQELAKRGYVVISIDYRTALLNPEVSAQAKPYYTQVISPYPDPWVPFVFPTLTEDQYERAVAAAYDDGLTALKWLAGHAVVNKFDMTRIAVMGSSSGSTTDLSLAYVSNNVGITTPKIAAVLDLWGSMEYSRVDGSLSEIEANEAPVFIIHSIGDTAAQGGVDYVNAKDIDARATAIGLHHELITLKPDPNGITPALKAGTGHGLSQVPILNVVSDNGRTLFQRLVDFLDGVLP